MDLTTARLEVRARLQELAADFWTDSEVDRALNDGVRRFNAEERWPWLLTEATDSLGAETETLALQEGVAVERQFNILVTFDGDPRPRELRRVSPTEGRHLRTTYYTSQSELSWYYLTSVADAGDPSEQLYVPTVHFVPVCSRDAELEYQYIRRSAVMDEATDNLDCPEEYTDGPVSWATGRLWMKELAYSAKAEEQFAIYTKVVDQARKETRRLTLDGGFAWGRNEPEPYGPVDPNTWVLQRIGESLG